MATSVLDIQAPQQQSEELYMLSRRDEVEKTRLNRQSNLIKIVRGGHVLDPSIPKDNIRRVADIATGTGIWLQELATELAEAGYQTPIETVGFDISSDQFPKNSPPENKFMVWDATTSFPSSYHSSFDVVHVRLLTVAVTVDQIQKIATNLVQLLRPGGHLQWTDWTYLNGWSSIYPSSLSPAGEAMYRFHGASGFSYDTTGDVARALSSLPMTDVLVTDHTGAARARPEIRGLVAEWHAGVIPLFMEMMAVRQGEGREEAKRIAELYREMARGEGEKGTVFELPINTLVARRV